MYIRNVKSFKNLLLILFSMNIDFVHIQNFRRLKNCRIELSSTETLFVGANNSGKTTAMDALILFLKRKEKFTTRDFTLSKWAKINEIGESWVKEIDKDKIDFSHEIWEEHLPTLDVWLTVNPSEIHHVNNLIPTLDWFGGLIGVRLRYEPNNVEALYNEFTSVYKNTTKIKSNTKIKNKDFSLWPKDLWDFLDNTNLNKFFTIKTYLLDPQLKDSPQKITNLDLPLEGEAFENIIKIDIINAQRGFSDVNSDSSENTNNTRVLSSQLRSYYDKHLNPTKNPTENDIDALQAMHEAKKIFDKNLKESFDTTLKELEILNYPGFGNPKISLSSLFNTVDTLNHESAVQYSLLDDGSNLSLPEKYNGLGYQNLISIIFKLIRFRDDWMQVGKSSTDQTSEKEFEPLHLVLIEEPEAHLHAQVQQVFIKKAYEVLRHHEHLKDNSCFTTQLIISTHSNHIAHEADFTSLRYFKRENSIAGEVNTSKVINLSKVFGSEDETTKFAIRYLKTTHCDLFFADAVIIVEGPVERMLLPYFIKHHTNLNNCYISILEIGGSHAHTLHPLIESLGIICLIIMRISS